MEKNLAKALKIEALRDRTVMALLMFNDNMRCFYKAYRKCPELRDRIICLLRFRYK